MPHAVFNLGDQTADADLAARKLVPGVEPGGGKLFGRRTKYALLIRDVTLQVNSFIGGSGGTTGTNGMKFFLKLSQDQDLNPGVLLYLGAIWSEYVAVMQDATGTGVGMAAAQLQDVGFKHAGTTWCPTFVGVRVETIGTPGGCDVDVHLDYEIMRIPWEEWLQRYLFLDDDDLTDNLREW